MPYLDRYKKASFRGVPFFVQQMGTEPGRKNVFYDVPFDESGGSVLRDLGKAPKKFTLEAILLGDDFDAAVQDLLEAFDEPGSGLLIHPFWGKHTVAVEGQPRVSITTVDGGMAQITVTFRKVKEKKSPGFGLDTASNLNQIADIALGALNGDFVDTFETDGFSEFVRDANIDAIGELTDKIADINRDIDSVLAIPGNIASDIQRLADEIVELINTPQELINTIQDTIESIFSSISRVLDALGSLGSTIKKISSMDENISPVPIKNTLNRKQEKVNQDAIVRAVKGSMLVSAARATTTLSAASVGAPLGKFKSASEAIELRDSLVSAFSSFLEQDEMDSTEVISTYSLETVAPQIDETYKALKAVVVALNQHLTQVAGDLPQVVTYTPAETLPTFVIAYQLYGDAERDTEIDDRNIDTVEHPLFAPVKEPLEVLASG